MGHYVEVRFLRAWKGYHGGHIGTLWDTEAAELVREGIARMHNHQRIAWWAWNRRFPDAPQHHEFFSVAERRYLLSLIPVEQATTGLRDRLDGGDTVLIARRVHASIGGSDPAQGYDPDYTAPHQSDDPNMVVARWLPTIAIATLTAGLGCVVGLLI